MNTLKRLVDDLESVPAATAWYLSDLAEFKGRQQLYMNQAPQTLAVLREHAIVESAVSSNRIEGVTIAAGRAEAVVLGRGKLRDRAEEEVRGYTQALERIHLGHSRLQPDERTIKKFHAFCQLDSGDRGQYKRVVTDIVERLPDGRSRIRFRTVSPKATPTAMDVLADAWATALLDRKVPPLVALAAHNLDFLCIHPFRDGNGRVSRLLLLSMWYRLGFEAGRYISLERLIEENKERYYETLYLSSVGWHEGRNDPWPYINYVLYIFRSAYVEFERRLGQTQVRHGAKSELVRAAVKNFGARPFTVRELQANVPGAGPDTVRKVLKDMKAKREVECLGRGRFAKWQNLEP